MGDKTKIDWCDASWNPVTGCLHGCEYCYARRIATRYGGYDLHNGITTHCHLKRAELHLPLTVTWNDGITRKAPYPFGFTPTLHWYKLDQPRRWTRPRNIFVCSMADLFGEWVPDEWITAVFDACLDAPWHRYLFLTKAPERYYSLATLGLLPMANNFWFGSSTPTPDTNYYYSKTVNTFVSIEPLHERFGEWTFKDGKQYQMPRWIIIGAETGNQRGKIIPQKSWVDEIAEQAKNYGIPVFMKSSLREIMGYDFRQEFPW